MVSPGDNSIRRFHRSRAFAWFAALIGILIWGHGEARAASQFQFDVFFGFNNIIRQGSWFPVACEIYNDGPEFKAVFQLIGESGGRSQVREMAVELPSQTRKRFIIPVFAAGWNSSWTARLVDENGKVRMERTGLRSQTEVSPNAMLIGGLPRAFGGLPVLPLPKSNRTENHPAVVRLEGPIFPDSPIALEGLNAIYLNSEKAIDLKAPQFNALLDWVYSGGHLVVAVEQPSDINGTKWLQRLLPMTFADVTTLKMDGTFVDWLRSGRSGGADDDDPSRSNQGRRNFGARFNTTLPTLIADPDFDDLDLPVATGTVKEGQTVFAMKGVPLMVEAQRGRGRVTVLTFSPERKPFAVWKHRPWFWVKVMGVPTGVFSNGDGPMYGNAWSLDGVFGAMIDSKQVRKLPVKWLLALLAVYLIVIGPLDQYILKKINRQMLTWITFPAYVVFFSAFIYWIGFKLRAGETEWSELHLVDVLQLPSGAAQYRGHTFNSIYSPANAQYEMASDPTFTYATVRGEYSGPYGGGQESSQSRVQQRGDGFHAELSVPVWVNQLYVSEWLRNNPMPMTAKVVAVKGGVYKVSVQNQLDHPIVDAQVVIRGRIYDLGALTAHEAGNFSLEAQKGQLLNEFVKSRSDQFAGAVRNRRTAFGDETQGRLGDLPGNSMAVSFLGMVAPEGNNSQDRFIIPERLDLSRLLDRGDAVVLAWDAGHGPCPPMNKFAPKRVNRDSLYRLAVPVSTE